VPLATNPADDLGQQQQQQQQQQEVVGEC
jgi:hypothetical protein